MQREIKQYEYFCDCCHKKVSGLDKLPHTVKVGPCGLTDYFRDEDWCTSCFKKYGHNYEQRKFTL